MAVGPKRKGSKMKKIIVLGLTGAALSVALVTPLWSCEQCGRPDRDTRVFKKVVRVLDTIINEPRHYPAKVVIYYPRPRVKKICNWRGCRTVWIGPARRHAWKHPRAYARHHRDCWDD